MFSMLDRRRFFALTAAGAAVAALPRMAFAQAKPFSLPPLGYAYEALEPNIDAQTMNIHHTRHHQAFINNLNTLVERWPDLEHFPITLHRILRRSDSYGIRLA
jgi:Fe-Mn family superoxide dismutase